MRVSAASVYAQLPFNGGETVSREQVSTAIQQLFRTGSFEDVSIQRDQDDLIVKLVERPSISEVKIEGNKAIDTDTLKNALKKAELSEGDIFKRSTLDHIRGELEKQYLGQGRYDSSIRVDVIPKPRNRVALHIVIDEGNSSRIKSIRFVGNRVFGDEELAKIFELKKSHMTSFFKGDDKYSRERLNGDLENLRSYYLDRGYFNFNINSTQVALSPDRKNVYIDINVTEGEKYNFGDAKILGDLPVRRHDIG